MLESNREEEETSKSRKEKPSYFIYFMFLFWRSLYTHLHMLWDHAFVYIQFLTSICLLCNCGLLTTLSEQLSSDLCFPAERIHYSEGAIEQTMPKHTTHTEEDTKGNLASSDIMDDICSQKMQPFYGRWKQFVVFSWKSHSDSRRYFALY